MLTPDDDRKNSDGKKEKKRMSMIGLKKGNDGKKRMSTKLWK